MGILNGYQKEILISDFVNAIGIRNYVRLKNSLTKYRFYKPGFIETKTIFIHVPKAAGSSIGENIYGTPSTGHYEWNYYFAENPEYFRDFFKFTFVREPLSRFMSAYNYLLDGGRSLHDQKVGDRIRAYGGIDSFVRNGLQNGNFLKFRHFRPQANFLFDADDRNMMNFIGRVETMAEDARKLSEAIGRNVSPKRANVTKRKTTSHGELSAETLKTICKIYERDFRLLGYPMPDPS